MTKRDVCIWFCKVVALVGMLSAVFGSIGVLWNLAAFGWINLLYSMAHLGLYLFVWFLAESIGTELAAEGDFGPPIAKGAELGSLLLRCTGLWLFLAGARTFGPTFLALAYDYFSSGRTTFLGANAVSNRFMIANISSGFVESLIGFLLAFTPRIRAFLRK